MGEYIRGKLGVWRTGSIIEYVHITGDHWRIVVASMENIIKIITVAWIHKNGPWYRNVVALNISNIFIEILAQWIEYCRFKKICRIKILWPLIFLWLTSIFNGGRGEPMAWCCCFIGKFSQVLAELALFQVILMQFAKGRVQKRN